MNTLSARDNYHKTHNEKERADLSDLINSTPVKEAMVYSLSHIALLGATKEQLTGAQMFCTSFLNLADAIAPQSEFKPMTMDPVPTPDGR